MLWVAMNMKWLIARAPGFASLSDEERSAIVDFSLLWTLFEARILGSQGSAAKICATMDAWENAGTLEAESFDSELTYFRNRYFADGDFTFNFDQLHLRPNDQISLVRSVLKGSNTGARDRTACIFIVILRYRNNLFHGAKWRYQLADQLGNFTTANSALMKALEQHGHLADD